jgi:rare lipoprotein A
MIRYFFSAVMAAALIPTQVSAATCGYASYYGVGDGFHGNMTANGEQFNAYGRTVAHRWLPFGTKIKGLSIRLLLLLKEKQKFAIV